MQGPYDDIIKLPHPSSRTHPRMSRRNRAAQFAPFAALTGYNASLQEAGRTTEPEPELDEDRKVLMDRQLCWLEAHLPDHPAVRISYFQPDPSKSGGVYLHCTDTVQIIDRRRCRIITDHGSCISMDQIVAFDLLSALPSGSDCFQ